MRKLLFVGLLMSSAMLLASVAASAQTQVGPPSTPYGTPITLEMARKVATAARQKAEQNKWMMAIAVVDPAGNLVYYERMDNTQYGSAPVAIDKARSAALYKRPTKAFLEPL